MLRILGIGLITAVVSVWGEKLIARQKKRVKALEAFLNFARSFEAKLKSFNIPIKSFLSEYNDEILELSGFLKSAVSTVNISEAVRKTADDLCLDEEDVKLVGEFGDGIGQYSIDEELKRCAYYTGEIQKRLVEAREKLPGEIKLLRSSGVMCGILAAVLLI